VVWFFSATDAVGECTTRNPALVKASLDWANIYNHNPSIFLEVCVSVHYVPLSADRDLTFLHPITEGMLGGVRIEKSMPLSEVKPKVIESEEEEQVWAVADHIQLKLILPFSVLCKLSCPLK
jgi:hypothetical protein